MGQDFYVSRLLFKWEGEEGGGDNVLQGRV